MFFSLKSFEISYFYLKVITTKAAAASETRVEGSPVVVGLTATQVESSKSASGSSSYYESQRR
jgi:hypothetical protein